MTALAPERTPLAWLRRHERTLAISWLALVALFAVVLALPPLRSRFLQAAQDVSDRWDLRWERGLAKGEALVRAERFAEAATFLERLDRTYPAPSAEHARDAEREQVLRLLARSYEGLGRNTRTMATYDRLIAFDPNNYSSPFLKGRAAERLLSGWAIAPEARDGYAAALKVFPSHLPSLRGYIQYYADRGEFKPIIDAYRTYLDAFLMDRVDVVIGDTVVSVPVLMDGRPHEIVIASPRPRADSIVIRGGPYIIQVDRARIAPAAHVGALTGDTVELSIAVARAINTAAVAPGRWRPTADSSAVVLPSPRASVGAVLLVLRVFKPMDRALWVVVARSYHNYLDETGKADADARTATFAKEAEADAALARLSWAHAGLQRLMGPP